MPHMQRVENDWMFDRATTHVLFVPVCIRMFVWMCVFVLYESLETAKFILYHNVLCSLLRFLCQQNGKNNILNLPRKKSPELNSKRKRNDKYNLVVYKKRRIQLWHIFLRCGHLFLLAFSILPVDIEFVVNGCVYAQCLYFV